ncbi:hypothetical protein [Borrelia sp. RT5S]|uniref:hypothetical protein n=1 Tax=Borrelia sp. RT5S TaxID=2898581 RepID=UPI001E52EEBA|nr:hypothetical protein [Borrelia sp. RT5S]UGQ16705.1 hypothetical protein LSO06_05140 [Borrelia sp. RT5S]
MSTGKQLGIIGSIVTAVFLGTSGLGTYATYALKGFLSEFRQEILDLRRDPVLESSLDTLKGRLEVLKHQLTDLTDEFTSQRDAHRELANSLGKQRVDIVAIKQELVRLTSLISEETRHKRDET